MDHLQWMGAVRVQTADKNITIIHKVSIYISLVDWLMSCEVKSCVFVKKQIHQDGLTPNRLFLYFSIAFSSEK